MSSHKLIRLRWKKKDYNRKGPFPYSFYHKKNNLDEFRGPDGYPYLIPSLGDESSHAKRYRDQVKKAEIEQIDNVHLKMFEFRQLTQNRVNVNSWEQKRNALPYWQFATRTKLLRGLPVSIQEHVRSLPESNHGALSDIVASCVRSYLLPKSPYHEKHDDKTDKHLNSFLKTLAFNLNHSHVLAEASQEFFFNSDSETCGFFGRDEHIYQIRNKPCSAQIRGENPLPPIVDIDSPLCQYDTEQIPDLPHNLEYYEEFVWENQKMKIPPRNKQWLKKRLPVEKVIPHGEIFSGVKPGSSYPFVNTHFQMLPRTEKFWLDSSDFYNQEINDCKCLLNSFSSLSSTAWYLKFTPYQDLTVPLRCNSIVFDGTNISFYIYQLNTIALGKMLLQEHNPTDFNSRANILWSTQSVPLYSYCENTSTLDLNSDALKLIISFITQKTVEQLFEIPESSWDPNIPEGIPLVRIDRDQDPGWIWIRPRRKKNWPEGWHQPKYKWNPEYLKRMEMDPNQNPYYEATEDHSEFIKSFNNRKKFLK